MIHSSQAKRNGIMKSFVLRLKILKTSFFIFADLFDLTRLPSQLNMKIHAYIHNTHMDANVWKARFKPLGATCRTSRQLIIRIKFCESQWKIHFFGPSHHMKGDLFHDHFHYYLNTALFKTLSTVRKWTVCP